MVSGVKTAGISIELLYCQFGVGCQSQTTSITDSQGRYIFSGRAALDASHYYYVRYIVPNSALCATRVNFYWSSNIRSYPIAGAGYHLEDFDLATFSEISPGFGATVGLPATFTWQRRTLNLNLVPPDNFTFFLFTPSNTTTGQPSYESALLGDVGTFQLTPGALGAGFAPGPFGWANLSYFNIGDGAAAQTCYYNVTLASVLAADSEAPPAASVSRSRILLEKMSNTAGAMRADPETLEP